MRLEGKISLITGAANAFLGKSMGFGGATAHLFCREGAKVIISDVNDDLGESAALKMRDSGFDVTYYHLDVTSESEWKTAINLITSKYGKLDVLVNNAGTCITKKFEDFTEADWIKDMDVNVIFCVTWRLKNTAWTYSITACLSVDILGWDLYY